MVFPLILQIIQAVIPVIIIVLKLAATIIRTVLVPSIQFILQIVQIVFPAVLKVIQNVLKIITNVNKLFTSVLKGDWKGAWDAIKNITSSVWNIIKTVISAAINVVKTVIRTAWNTIKSITSSVWNSIKSIILSIWNGIKTTVSNVVNGVRSTISNVFNNIRTIVGDKMRDAKNKITQIWNQVLSFFKGIDLYGIGKDIIQGLINGIGSMASAVWEKARSIAKGITDKIKSVLKIHSPSRVMYELGKFVGQGLRNGIAGTAAQVTKTAQTLATKVRDAIQSGLETKETKSKQLNSAILTLRQQEKELNDIAKKRKSVVNRIAALNKKLSSARSKRERTAISKQIAAERKQLASLTKQQQAARNRVKKSQVKVSELKANVKEAERLISLKSLQGYINQQTKKLNAIAKQRDTINAKLKDANKKLADLVKESEEYARNIADKAKSYGSISSLQVTSGQQIDANTIKNHLQQRLKDIQGFAANIDKLRKKGLSESIISDILEQGIDQGANYAAALANADAETIKQINSLQSQITKASDTLGKKAADAMYSAGINAAKGLIKGLESQKKQLDKAANAIADAISKAIKKKLKIHSPSRETRDEIGKPVVLGVIDGIEALKAKAVKVAEQMASWVVPKINSVHQLQQHPNTLSTAISENTAARQPLELRIESSDVILDGRKVGSVIWRPVKENIDFFTDREARFRGSR